MNRQEIRRWLRTHRTSIAVGAVVLAVIGAAFWAPYSEVEVFPIEDVSQTEQRSIFSFGEPDEDAQLIESGEWITESYGDDNVQAYDVWRPVGADGDAPMIIIVHGGGEDEPGDKRSMRERGLWYASHGAVVVTPNYRYGDGQPLQDVACAMLTAKANVARYGADVDRIVVHGFSFGGWITSFFLYASDTQPLPSCAATGDLSVVGFIGESTQFGNPPAGDHGLLVNVYDDIVGDDRDGATNYVDVGDPPALLLHGDKDPKFNEQRAIDFADALERIGVPVTVKIYEGFGHSAQLADSPQTQRDVLEFLKSL